MNLKKQVIVEAITTDGKPMEIGKTYVFNLGGRDHVGVYDGLGYRQMLRMKNVIPGCDDVVFNITPKSVQAIYEADVEIYAK